MNLNSRYFLSLVTSFLYETVPPRPIQIDWEQVYGLSRIHYVSGAVYLAVKRLTEEDRPEQSILNKFKNDFYKTYLRYEEQEKIYQDMKAILNENRIKHLFFKGIVLSEYYPVKQMRTLGDLDFLIQDKNHGAVNKALTEIGFVNISNSGHWQYSKGKFLVEAHDRLMYSKINSKANYILYFEDVWEHAHKKDSGDTYELDLEYHIIFLLTHIAKHLYGQGCGVRMVLDIAVIMKKFGDLLNYTYLWQELRKIKLDAFANNIFALCARWFGTSIPDGIPEMDEDAYECITAYILDGGTFGFNNRSFSMNNIRMEYSEDGNIQRARIKAVISKIKSDSETLINRYPFLNRRPYLMPIAWICRAFESVIITPKKTIGILKSYAHSNSAEVENSYEVIKKIGLL